MEKIFSTTGSSTMSMSSHVSGAPMTLRASRPKDSRNQLFAFSTTRSQLTTAMPARMELTMVSLYSLRRSVSRIDSCIAARLCSSSRAISLNPWKSLLIS